MLKLHLVWLAIVHKQKQKQKELQRRGYANPSFGQPVGWSVTEKIKI